MTDYYKYKENTIIPFENVECVMDKSDFYYLGTIVTKSGQKIELEDDTEANMFSMKYTSWLDNRMYAARELNGN